MHRHTSQTIRAGILILTLLSVSANSDHELDESFYRQVRQVAQLDVAAFVGAMLLLVALVIPPGGSADMSHTFYTVAYYAFSALAAVTSGLLVSVVLALYITIHNLIETFWLDGSPLESSDDQASGAGDSSKTPSDAEASEGGNASPEASGETD